MSSTESIPHLSYSDRRYCYLTDESTPSNSSQHVPIMRQILEASANLRHLALEICDMPDCSSVYSNLQSLHLMLEHSIYKDRDPFDIDRFVRLMPGLRRLETSVANLMLDQKLVDFILDIITTFPQLVYLVINKHSRYPSPLTKRDHFSQLFVAACQERGYDGSMIDLRFNVNDEISVWL